MKIDLIYLVFKLQNRIWKALVLKIGPLDMETSWNVRWYQKLILKISDWYLKEIVRINLQTNLYGAENAGYFNTEQAVESFFGKRSLKCVKNIP